jgi:hypothetical protein
LSPGDAGLLLSGGFEYSVIYPDLKLIEQESCELFVVPRKFICLEPRLVGDLPRLKAENKYPCARTMNHEPSTEIHHSSASSTDIEDFGDFLLFKYLLFVLFE